MEKIKIITDSTCDLPPHIIEKYNIEVLPLTVNFGKEAFRDGVDINLNEFFSKMKESDVFPTTSQVNPQNFYNCYKKYSDMGYNIISIHISSKMSGTYQSACIAKEMLGTENITIIDSQNVTSGLGLLVIKACMLISEGLNVIDIENEIINMIPHIKSSLAFESLDNLVKGGRLSKAAGLIGNILGIKLILEVKEGEISVKEKARGTKKAVKTILDYFEERGMRKGEPCILLHVENKDILEPLRENLISKSIDFIEAEVGCVVGTHSGPGACGIFFIENY